MPWRLHSIILKFACAVLMLSNASLLAFQAESSPNFPSSLVEAIDRDATFEKSRFSNSRMLQPLNANVTTGQPTRAMPNHNPIARSNRQHQGPMRPASVRTPSETFRPTRTPAEAIQPRATSQNTRPKLPDSATYRPGFGTVMSFPAEPGTEPVPPTPQTYRPSGQSINFNDRDASLAEDSQTQIDQQSQDDEVKPVTESFGSAIGTGIRSESEMRLNPAPANPVTTQLSDGLLNTNNSSNTDWRGNAINESVNENLVTKLTDTKPAKTPPPIVPEMSQSPVAEKQDSPVEFNVSDTESNADANADVRPSLAPPSTARTVSEQPTPALTAQRIAADAKPQTAQPNARFSNSIATSIVGPEVLIQSKPDDFEIVITNSGNLPVSEVIVQLTVPEDLTISRLDREAWLDREQRTVSWKIGQIPAYGKEVIKYQAVSSKPGQHQQKVLIGIDNKLQGETPFEIGVITEAKYRDIYQSKIR